MCVCVDILSCVRVCVCVCVVWIETYGYLLAGEGNVYKKHLPLSVNTFHCFVLYVQSLGRLQQGEMVNGH